MEKQLIRKTYQVEVVSDKEAKELFDKAQKVYQCNLKGIPINEERTLVVKISTSTPDRSNDVVVPTGAKLENYLNNPVVAAFHKYDRPSVGRTVQIGVTDTDIVVRMEFATKGVNPEADMLHDLYKGGFQHAASIGFSWKDEDMEVLPEGGKKFNSWELYEWSLVLVGANPEALDLMKSKGFDPERIMEEQEEALKKAQTNPAPVKKKSKPSVAEKDVAETVALAMLIDHLNFLVQAIERNEVSAEVIEKMKEALGILMEVIKIEAELGKKMFVVKEGRVLSEKNRTLIVETISQMKGATKALKTLLSATEKENDGKAVKSDNIDFILDIRNELRKNDKGVGKLLRNINSYLKQGKSKTEGGE